MLSFLNVYEFETGRQIRLAELGGLASKPSFVDGGIAFLRDGEPVVLELSSGRITAIASLPYKSESDRIGVKINYLSDEVDGVAYVELLVNSFVAARFMGSRDSIGANPISSDGKKLVFIGYPSQAGIG